VKTALTHIIKLTMINELFVICSENMALKDQFVLRRLLDVVINTICFMEKKRFSNIFSISSDTTPNISRAILTNPIIKEKIVSELKELNQKI
jgi:hypothetical protein